MKIKLSYQPPPPPPPPTSAKSRKGLLAAIVIVIILVATLVPLFAFNIISFGPKASPSPSPTATASPTASPTAVPTITPSFSPTATPTPTPTGTPTPTPTGTPSTENYGVLIGTVVDTSNDPLADVTVAIGTRSSTTNNQGWFSVADITPGNRQIVKFSKAGYATTYQVTDITEGESSSVQSTMSAVDQTETFDASQGTTVSTWEGSSVTIGPNALETQQGSPYTGTAQISVTSFDPTNEMEANAFPGEFLGRAVNQTIAPIKSFGFMDVLITSQSGEELQLKSGETAPLSIHVPVDLQTDAAALGTCPLWYFDTSTGLWQEEGQGTYDAGTETFTGTVSHFSTWNYDIMYPAAYISGRVVDSDGNPVQGAQVKCWGRGWYNQRWASGETMTNENGYFTRIPVEVGVTFQYQASKGGHQSTVLQAGPLELNQEYNVGDIILDAPLIQITLTWGENPSDLDSHLAANLTSGSDFHVYYGDQGSLTSFPYANLDTDDVSSFGPEVVSISKLQPGTYRYSVRHYYGDGTIATSGAEINLVVPGIGIYRYTPPASQPAGTDIWRVFDIVIGPSGVTAVNTINDYVTGNDHSSLLYPP